MIGARWSSGFSLCPGNKLKLELQPLAGTATLPDYFKKISRSFCIFFRSGRLTYIMWPASYSA